MSIYENHCAHRSRRSFCTLAGGAFASLALNSACRLGRSNLANNGLSEGRLTARPHSQSASQTPNSKSFGNAARGEAIKLGVAPEGGAAPFFPKTATHRP